MKGPVRAPWELGHIQLCYCLCKENNFPAAINKFFFLYLGNVYCPSDLEAVVRTSEASDPTV
jgi:hypothetical protein